MITFTIRGKAPSTPNLREHHMARARRVKFQRTAVAAVMPRWISGPLLHIRLTRVAPRALDTDNLAAALKAHRDAVAARLRVDDATPLIQWHYAQEKGEPTVVVHVWTAAEPVPPIKLPEPSACMWGHPGCEVHHPMPPPEPSEVRTRLPGKVRRDYLPPLPACGSAGCMGCDRCEQAP